MEKNLLRILKYNQKDIDDENQMYPRKAIESAFKAIAEKLNVYNVELRIYDLSKSNVLMSVFSSKKKFKEEQIWDKLLTKKCSKTKDDLLRPTSPTHPSTNP